jgi:hypothetical protein
MERLVSRWRNPHSCDPIQVACWPDGANWPPPEKKE